MMACIRNDQLILSSSRIMIQNMNWNDFLTTCGYDVLSHVITEKEIAMSILRRGIEHQLAIVRISEESIQLSAKSIRFPIARLLGCIGFHIQSEQAKDVSFEIYKVSITDEFLRDLSYWCTSISPDTLTYNSGAITERIFNICPNMLLPKMTSHNINNIYAHYISINSQEYIGISSDKYVYNDWVDMLIFNELRGMIDDHGGKCLGFVVT